MYIRTFFLVLIDFEWCFCPCREAQRHKVACNNSSSSWFCFYTHFGLLCLVLDCKEERWDWTVYIWTYYLNIIVICILPFVHNCVKWSGDKTKEKQINVETAQTDSTAIVLKDESESVNIDRLPVFTLETLANATDQFHVNNLLGRGGFGLVYKVHTT